MEGYNHHAEDLPFRIGERVEDTFKDRVGKVVSVRYQVGSGKPAAGMISVMLRKGGFTWHARTSVCSNRLVSLK